MWDGRTNSCTTTPTHRATWPCWSTLRMRACVIWSPRSPPFRQPDPALTDQTPGSSVMVASRPERAISSERRCRGPRHLKYPKHPSQPRQRVVQRVVRTFRRTSGSVDVAASSPLLHVALDVTLDTNLDTEIAGWLSFARQKLDEIVTLRRGLTEGHGAIANTLHINTE